MLLTTRIRKIFEELLHQTTRIIILILIEKGNFREIAGNSPRIEDVEDLKENLTEISVITEMGPRTQEISQGTVQKTQNGKMLARSETAHVLLDQRILVHTKMQVPKSLLWEGHLSPHCSVYR